MNVFKKISVGSNQKGFSLVEMLVYLGILAVVSGGSVTLLFSLDSIISQHRAQQLIARNATTALERALYEVRASDTVNTGSSVLGSSPGTLTLTSGATTTTFTLASGVMKVQTNAGAANALTSSEVSVTNLKFERLTNTRTEMVRIYITLSATVGHQTVSESFTSSSVLLNSYD